MTQNIPCQKTNLICNFAKLHAQCTRSSYDISRNLSLKLFTLKRFNRYLNSISTSQVHSAMTGNVCTWGVIVWEQWWYSDPVRKCTEQTVWTADWARISQSGPSTAVHWPIRGQPGSPVVAAVMVRCMKITFSCSVQNKNCKHITLLVYICSQLHNASGYFKQFQK